MGCDFESGMEGEILAGAGWQSMGNVGLFTLFLNMCLFLRFVQKFTLISAFKVADR